MSQRSSHRICPPIEVALIVDQGTNHFEMAYACEIFGARRGHESGYELYRLRLVSPELFVTMRYSLFTITVSSELYVLDEAHSVIVPNPYVSPLGEASS
jgi:hypothetical protein